MPTNKTTLPWRMPSQQKGSVETFNAGRAGAHPSYGGCQAWIVGVAIISFFKCDGVAIFAVMRKVLIWRNALRRKLADQHASAEGLCLAKPPSNPNRATRSGVEEKNGISAEGRAKRSYAGFFLPLRYALRHPESLFRIRPKATLFLKEAPHRCEEAFCQLNIEVSSLQGLSEFNSSTVQPPIRSWSWASLHDALSASVRSEAERDQSTNEFELPKGCSGRTPLQSRLQFVLLV